MFRCAVLILVLVSNYAAGVSARECDELGMAQARPSVKKDGATICFVKVETPPQSKHQLSQDPDGIVTYSLSEHTGASLIYEFPYTGTESEIVDVFSLPIGYEQKEVLFVIYKSVSPPAWDTVSDIYDVSAFRFAGGEVTHDKKLSKFFGFGGDLADDDGKHYYRYPFKNREAVSDFTQSTLFGSLVLHGEVNAVVRSKTLLYEGNREPSYPSDPKIYLAEGDNVLIRDSTTGWCKVGYLSAGKYVYMWAECDSLLPVGVTIDEMAKDLCRSDEVLVAGCRLREKKYRKVSFCANEERQEIIYRFGAKYGDEMTRIFTKMDPVRKRLDYKNTAFFEFDVVDYTYSLGLPKDTSEAKAFLNVSKSGELISSRLCLDNSFSEENLRNDAIRKY